MKTFIAVIVLALIAFGAWFFLKGRQASEPAPITVTSGEEVVLEDGTYAVASSSSIGWSGARPLIPGYRDNGTVAIKAGNVVVSNGVITGGSFTIDMTTIAALSTGKGGGEDMLSGHLKSADFFDVGKFPTAVFAITGATANGEITGNLTVKETTEQITFPAAISQEGNTVRAVASIELDRTVWNIRYGSGKFFENLGNNLIDDKFIITLDLAAEKTS